MPRYDFTREERRAIHARLNPTVFAAWGTIAALALVLVASYVFIGRLPWLR